MTSFTFDFDLADDLDESFDVAPAADPTKGASGDAVENPAESPQPFAEVALSDLVRLLNRLFVFFLTASLEVRWAPPGDLVFSSEDSGIRRSRCR
jgi:hypothetical protein